MLDDSGTGFDIALLCLGKSAIGFSLLRLPLFFLITNCMVMIMLHVEKTCMS